MKVHIRRKPVVNGKNSLYLEFNINGERKYEFLRLNEYRKPSTPAERKANREVLQLVVYLYL